MYNSGYIILCQYLMRFQLLKTFQVLSWKDMRVMDRHEVYKMVMHLYNVQEILMLFDSYLTYQ